MVVHGVGGQRDDYHPIKSDISQSPHPAAVAKSLVEAFSCQQIYVADLDAICHGRPDFDSWRAIADQGLELWLDAGVSSAGDIRRIDDFCQANKIAYRPIVALETISDRSSLESIARACGDSAPTFSLDLKHGVPLTNAKDFQARSANEVADLAVEAGYKSLIVLDLTQVGSNRGAGLLPLIGQIHSRHPSIQLLSGGGVRSENDLLSLINAGCDKVLIASALHDGRLDAEAILRVSS